MKSGELRHVKRRGPKLHRLSIDGYPGRGLIKLNRDVSKNDWVTIPAQGKGDYRNTWVSGPKFPKLDECTHFHYDVVDLSPDFRVSIRADYGDHELHINKSDGSCITVYYVHVQCDGLSWTIARRYTDAITFDIQLHRCVFDRRYSSLPILTSEDDVSDAFTDAFHQLSEYFRRLTALIRDSTLVKCGSVLNWLEMDNKGHHFLWHVNSGINVPGIAVATVTRNYVKREDDELELRVGDLVSIIDMPNVNESPWWRGKHSNKVGFFPSSCVEVIPGSVHGSGTGVRKQTSKISLKCDVTMTVDSPTEPPDVNKKKKRLKHRLAILFASRPDRDSLRQKGILRGRVFGAHLSEHLFDSNADVPLVVRVCCTTIEEYGIVDGIYRKPGVSSNIQKLRQEFDSDSPPSKIDNRYLTEDIHCVSSLCKMYFRELPDPLLTFQLYDQFAEAVSFNVVEMKLSAIRKVVQQLPPYHYSTLGYLTNHLNRVAAQSDVHGMHSRNLALVWAPNLLKPLASESDASAFTEIKIQSVVLQFLIDHASAIFCDEEIPGTATPNSYRLSVGSQVTNGSCNSPLDSMSQTSSIQLIHAAGFRAQRRNINATRYSYPDHELGGDNISNTSDVIGATADIVRNRTISDVTSTPTGARYQYRMKIPLLELSEAQRAHAVSETDIRGKIVEEQEERQKALVTRKKENKKKKYEGSIRTRNSDYNITGTNWARSIFNKFSIRRTQSLHQDRPVISGPCGFVADPYSTVLSNNLPVPDTGTQEGTTDRDDTKSEASIRSSLNSSTLKNNVLMLGNATNMDVSALDKSDFVNDWCNDTIRQFLDGKPLSSIQATTVTDRSAAAIIPPPRGARESPKCHIRRSKSLPHRQGIKKNEDIAFVLKELQDVSKEEVITEHVRKRFNTILGSSTYSPAKQPEGFKRSKKNPDHDPDERPSKHPRPLSCPSVYSEHVVPPFSMRKSRSWRYSSSNMVTFQHTILPMQDKHQLIV